ncbi:hypothetical protein [Brucella rhizosphaerae]|uniref:Uncharacterized protein n=1 Tax=Brucella rhizosphaerae TaxID=571254 RepID=A0A256F8J0_9HYPH|nr:hypothetical protein [Brucella rhizosphaerae]OYR11164.1 hypothetical protein CEV32_1462 [Brucella rhizosphaerae]
MDTENHFYWNTAKGSIVVITALTGELVASEFLTDLISVPVPPAGNDWVWDADTKTWSQHIT